MAGMSAERRAAQSEIFKKAWQAAREAAKKYGGKAYQYFSVKGENVLSDVYEKTNEITVNVQDLPYLKWDEWHKAFRALYNELERESKLEGSSDSFLILNFAEDNFDIDMSKYKNWQNSNMIKKNHVIAELKSAWERINGKEVLYIAEEDVFVYRDSYEIYKKAGYTDQDIAKM